MSECDSFQMIMAVVAGNFLTFLALAMAANGYNKSKKKEKDEEKDDNKRTK